MSETITIPIEEHERLKRSDYLVLAMDVLKVEEHWDGYEEATEMAEYMMSDFSGEATVQHPRPIPDRYTEQQHEQEQDQ